MARARFKDLCIDAVDPTRLGRFWAAVLGLDVVPDDRAMVQLVGPSANRTVWINRVPEPKRVKHRVHLDVYADSIDSLVRLGAAVVAPEGEGRRWTVMADPEGGEFCAFRRPEPPPDRLHAIVVDTEHPAAQARWWAELVGGRVEDDPRGYCFVTGVPALPVGTLDFIAVPESKSAKNRIHLDVVAADLQALLAHGAQVLRPPVAPDPWFVLADPEGNEFCAFIDPPDPTGGSRPGEAGDADRPPVRPA
jgi:predicted enzyme related to lactoylglutathione lyase